MMRDIETWLSDGRISNSSVVDHRSQICLEMMGTSIVM